MLNFTSPPWNKELSLILLQLQWHLHSLGLYPQSWLHLFLHLTVESNTHSWPCPQYSPSFYCTCIVTTLTIFVNSWEKSTVCFFCYLQSQNPIACNASFTQVPSVTPSWTSTVSTVQYPHSVVHVQYPYPTGMPSQGSRTHSHTGTYI